MYSRSTFLLVLITVCLCACSTQKQATSAVKSKSPEFSWDKIPLYMHLRKSTSFTKEEIQFISKFPLITFEKSTGHKTYKSSEKGILKAAKAVKKISPGAKKGRRRRKKTFF